MRSHQGKDPKSEACLQSIAAIRDTLYVLSGKWKLPIIVALSNGPQRFKDLQRALEDITPKILSKELKELEMNDFVTRTVYATSPVTVEYALNITHLCMVKTASMKLIICFLLTCSLFTCLCAQPFEGRIIYKNTYHSKMAAVADEQLAVMMGNQQEYLVRKGNYKVLANGSMFEWQLYVQADNKLYTKTANGPTILWNDATENPDSLLREELRKEVVDILGYKCDELVFTTSSGSIKYYFNSQVAADPQQFAMHKFGFWSALVAKTHALPLKYILETPQLVLESVAAEIKPMPLEKALFELPAGAKPVRSPY